MSEKPKDVNPIDAWANIQKMRDTEGWKILMERYAKEGNEIMSKLLALDITNDEKYGLRDLYAYQLHALGRLAQVIDEMEIEAKSADMKGKEPAHIGT